MKRFQRFSTLTALAALSSTCLAAAPASQSPPQENAAPARAAANPAQGLPKVCLDVQTADPVTQEFAARLTETIDRSAVMTLGSATDTCSLRLHVPGNLLRFETGGGVMISTVVIVTSGSGQYLSSSITACGANNLKPCAARAVAIAKLDLLTSSTQ